MKLYDNDSYRDEFMNGVYALLSSDPTNDRANQIIDLFDLVPAVEVTAEPFNDPLTLDELREMEGEPVWVQIAGGDRYAVIRSCGEVFTEFTDGGQPPNDKYGIYWLAYRRKPEGECSDDADIIQRRRGAGNP